jgi:positive regulator of sigma E activity
MKSNDPNKFKVYAWLCVLFFAPLVIFILSAWLFLPLKLATTVIGFVGLIVIIAGPIWAMQLERRLRAHFMPKKKRDYEAVLKLLDENEDTSHP